MNGDITFRSREFKWSNVGFNGSVMTNGLILEQAFDHQPITMGAIKSLGIGQSYTATNFEDGRKDTFHRVA